MGRRFERVVILILSCLLAVVGAFVAVVQLPVADSVNNTLQKVMLFGGLGVSVFGIVVFVLCLCSVAHGKRRGKVQKDKEDVVVQQPVPQENAQVVVEQSTVKAALAEEKQSVEEKFCEIAKMDRTQFVIYIARLFGCKGYHVKFTPVMDNYGVDLLVEKEDEICGVCCILSNKVLCAEDIAFVPDSLQRYCVQNGTVLTNLYFDKSACVFARKRKISLVDRSILEQDFMK